jgi:RimJ/RimL family protein N-acetyltransferase
MMVEMLKNGDESVVHQQVKDYFDSGGEAFLGFSEGKLVHIAWLFYNLRISEVHFFVKIKEDEAYIGSCQTHPEFRGKNIYPVVLQHILRDAAAKNKKRCFIATIPTNLASIRGIEKSGFSFVGKMRMFKLFGKFFNNQWGSCEVIKLD